MTSQEVWEMLEQVGAVITGGHFVYTGDLHGRDYVDKNAVYPHTTETSDLCEEIADRFTDDSVETVIGPTVGGVILSQWVAYHLCDDFIGDVFSVYADKNRQSKPDGRYENIITIRDSFHRFISGKRVLVVDDILTTGGSAKAVVEAVRRIGGNVIGLGALVNRGGVTVRDVGDVPKLIALAGITLDAWDEATCPLCQKGVPINTEVGKGREFLARLELAAAETRK